MIMRLLSQKQCEAILGSRITSLIEDGYRVVLRVQLANVWVIRLRHQAKRKFILIKYWPLTHKMEQWTDGNLVYSGKVTG